MAVKKITMLECTCEKCGKVWISRTSEPPAVCPGCKNPRWQKVGTSKAGRPKKPKSS